MTMSVRSLLTFTLYLHNGIFMIFRINMNYITKLAGLCNGDALFTAKYKFNIYIHGT